MDKCSTTWISCKLLKILSTSIAPSSIYRWSFIFGQLNFVLYHFLDALHCFRQLTSDHVCPLSLSKTKMGGHIIHVDIGHIGCWTLDTWYVDHDQFCIFLDTWYDDHDRFYIYIYIWILDMILNAYLLSLDIW